MPEEEGAETAPALAAALRPGAQDDFLRAKGLDLRPVGTAPTGSIGRGSTLGDDTFEPVLDRGGEDVLSRDVPERVGRDEGLTGEMQRLQSVPSLVVGGVQQRMAVEVEEVERDEGDRIREGTTFRIALVRHVHALLQSRKARASIRTQGHNLAVDDAGGHAEELSDVGQLRERDRDVEVVSAVGTHPPPFHEEDGADPVPLDLEGPVLAVGGQVTRRPPTWA